MMPVTQMSWRVQVGWRELMAERVAQLAVEREVARWEGDRWAVRVLDGELESLRVGWAALANPEVIGRPVGEGRSQTSAGSTQSA